MEVCVNSYSASYKKLVGMLITLPLAMTFLSFALLVGNFAWSASQVSYKSYFKKDVKLRKYKVYKDNEIKFLDVEKAFGRMLIRLEKRGFYPSLAIVTPMLFIFTLCGSYALTLNPVLKKEDEIREALTNFKYKNPDGTPWDFIYNPEGIVFTTYGVIPEVFRRDTAFWQAIGFSPQNPIPHPDNQSTVLFVKSTSIPNFVSFGEFTELPSFEELLGEDGEGTRETPQQKLDVDKDMIRRAQEILEKREKTEDIQKEASNNEG